MTMGHLLHILFPYSLRHDESMPQQLFLAFAGVYLNVACVYFSILARLKQTRVIKKWQYRSKSS